VEVGVMATWTQNDVYLLLKYLILKLLQLLELRQLELLF
jgi:hypothetical protein